MDGLPNVGNEVMGALVRSGEPAVDPLIEALRGSSAHGRQRIVETLARIGDARAAGAVIPLLKDRDQYLRLTVIFALSEFRDPQAVEPLIAALQHDDIKERSYAAGMLGDNRRHPRGTTPCSSCCTNRNRKCAWRRSSHWEN